MGTLVAIPVYLLLGPVTWRVLELALAPRAAPPAVSYLRETRQYASHAASVFS
jgi:hypothetical protein